MKKLVLGVVVLVALGLATSPARAAAGATQEGPVLSAEDQAFLATLAVPEAVPAPELVARRPAGIGTKATCSISCGSSTISCPAGTTTCGAVNRSCPSEPGHIVCDGVTTWCPACVDCNALFTQCENSCNDCVKYFLCSPYTCRCGPPCI
jgi:hypothetical protein